MQNLIQLIFTLHKNTISNQYPLQYFKKKYYFITKLQKYFQKSCFHINCGTPAAV